MAQGYDQTKPEFQAGLSSEVLRVQLNALASHHEGVSQPIDVQRGMLWLDTSDGANWKLKVRTDTDWVVVLENVATVPTVPGGGSQYFHSVPVASNPWAINHDLGKRIVPVIVVDAAWNALDPSSYTVNYVDENNLTITFVTGATSGSAYLN